MAFYGGITIKFREKLSIDLGSIEPITFPIASKNRDPSFGRSAKFDGIDPGGHILGREFVIVGVTPYNFARFVFSVRPLAAVEVPGFGQSD